jgi:hypothetical protein
VEIEPRAKTGEGRTLSGATTPVNHDQHGKVPFPDLVVLDID